MKLSSFLHFATFGIKTILFKKKTPILGTVIVTDKCNLHCKHCSVNNITAIVHPYEQIQREYFMTWVCVFSFSVAGKPFFGKTGNVH